MILRKPFGSTRIRKLMVNGPHLYSHFMIAAALTPNGLVPRLFLVSGNESIQPRDFVSGGGVELPVA